MFLATIPLRTVKFNRSLTTSLGGQQSGSQVSDTCSRTKAQAGRLWTDLACSKHASSGKREQINGVWPDRLKPFVCPSAAPEEFCPTSLAKLSEVKPIPSHAFAWNEGLFLFVVFCFCLMRLDFISISEQEKSFANDDSRKCCRLCSLTARSH